MNTLPSWALIVYLAAITVLALACWGFVVLYSLAYRWWLNPFGRNLVGFSASLGVLATYALVVAVKPDLPHRMWVWLSLTCVLAGVAVWRLVVFGRYDLARRREIKAAQDDEKGAA